jgi:hypothetical protein
MMTVRTETPACSAAAPSDARDVGAAAGGMSRCAGDGGGVGSGEDMAPARPTQTYRSPQQTAPKTQRCHSRQAFATQARLRTRHGRLVFQVSIVGFEVFQHRGQLGMAETRHPCRSLVDLPFLLKPLPSARRGGLQPKWCGGLCVFSLVVVHASRRREGSGGPRQAWRFRSTE